MANDLQAIARLAATAEAAPKTAPTAAAGFVTTVRRAGEIPSFETVVTRAAAESGAVLANPSPTSDTAAAAAAPAAKRTEKARKSFEAFALQVFIGSMLPKENTKLFGTGSAGKMWQAMLAEKLADQIAASGRLKLVPDQAAGTPSPATAISARDAAAAGAAPVGGASKEMSAGSNAAMQAMAIGLKPGRNGGTR